MLYNILLVLLQLQKQIIYSFNMKSREELVRLSRFLSKYSAHLMGTGVHTSRIVRNTKRIGQSFGVDTKLSVFQKTIIISLYDEEIHRNYAEVVECPHKPILFAHNTGMSELSWEAFDHPMPLEELEEKFEKLSKMPLLNPYLILLLASLANLSFCKLFGGDYTSMAIVFTATVVGFQLKAWMLKWHCNIFITFATSALVASMIASTSLLFDTTSSIALATSVLYLIPGVPLVNGVIDILEGYALTGTSRLINAMLLILCIAIGLGITLFTFHNSLL